MAALPILFPEGWIGAADAVARVLGDGKREIVGIELESQDCRIDVVEEVQIGVRHLKGDWRLTGRERDTQRVHVTSAKYMNRRTSSVESHFAVKKALNEG